MQVNSSKNLYNLLQECKQHKQNVISSHKIDPALCHYTKWKIKQTNNVQTIHKYKICFES